MENQCHLPQTKGMIEALPPPGTSKTLADGVHSLRSTEPVPAAPPLNVHNGQAASGLQVMPKSLVHLHFCHPQLTFMLHMRHADYAINLVMSVKLLPSFRIMKQYKSSFFYEN